MSWDDNQGELTAMGGQMKENKLLRRAILLAVISSVGLAFAPPGAGHHYSRYL